MAAARAGMSCEMTSTTEPGDPTKRDQRESRYYEDLRPHDVFVSRFGRTVTEVDNLLFTMLSMNTNAIHFDAVQAEGSRWKRILVNSTFTFALVTGLSVQDVSEHAAANLDWTDVKLPNPVFIGDTLWAESEVLSCRPSESTPSVGIVAMRTRGINQRKEVVIEFKRTAMIYRRGVPEATSEFPGTGDSWRV